MDPSNALPVEILMKILSYLPPAPDYAVLACVSKRWNDLITRAMEIRLTTALSDLNHGAELRWYPIYGESESANSDPYPCNANVLGASATINGNTMYVFGGATSQCTTLNTLHSFNMLTLRWSRVLTQGSRPSPRAFALSGFVDDDLYIFGGCKYVSQGYGAFQEFTSVNDLYSISPSDWDWRGIRGARENPNTSIHSNGVFLPACPADGHPAILLLVDTGSSLEQAEEEDHRLFQLLPHPRPYAILPSSGRWIPLPDCPFGAKGNYYGCKVPTHRPVVCAVGPRQVLIMAPGRSDPCVWMLQRQPLAPNSQGFESAVWQWNRVRIEPPGPLSTPPESIFQSVAIAVPFCRSNGDGNNPTVRPEWPTVMVVSNVGKDAAHAHINKRRRILLQKQIFLHDDVVDGQSLPGLALSSPTAASSMSNGSPNPMISVFAELPSSSRPGQPIQGAILRRASTTLSPAPLSQPTPTPRPASNIRVPLRNQPTGSASNEPFVMKTPSLKPFRYLAAYTMRLETRGDPQTDTGFIVGRWEGPLTGVAAPAYLPRARLGFTCIYSMGSLVVFGGEPVDIDEYRGTTCVWQQDSRMLAVHGKKLAQGFAKYY